MTLEKAYQKIENDRQTGVYTEGNYSTSDAEDLIDEIYKDFTLEIAKEREDFQIQLMELKQTHKQELKAKDNEHKREIILLKQAHANERFQVENKNEQ